METVKNISSSLCVFVGKVADSEVEYPEFIKSRYLIDQEIDKMIHLFPDAVIAASYNIKSIRRLLAADKLVILNTVEPIEKVVDEVFGTISTESYDCSLVCDSLDKARLFLESGKYIYELFLGCDIFKL